jgi:hypothetical protein
MKIAARHTPRAWPRSLLAMDDADPHRPVMPKEAPRRI